MKPPVIPDTLRICRICEEELATLEGLCPDCYRVKRMMAASLDTHAGDKKGGFLAVRPSGLRGMSVDEALEWASGGVIHPQPRIQEVPAPAAATVPREHHHSALRWASYIAIAAFVLGFVFGRMCN
jgi:hypothetical protein